MLRFSLMPSDYHPHVLFLGENDDIARLASILRAFAVTRSDIAFKDADAVRSPDTRLTLSSAPGPQGVHSQGDAYDLVWRLDPERALLFASRLSDLAAEDRLSGSEHLDCEVQDEVPVWVSKGEFAEGFVTA